MEIWRGESSEDMYIWLAGGMMIGGGSRGKDMAQWDGWGLEKPKQAYGAADLKTFDNYWFKVGRCSDELKSIIPPKACFARGTRSFGRFPTLFRDQIRKVPDHYIR